MSTLRLGPIIVPPPLPLSHPLGIRLPALPLGLGRAPPIRRCGSLALSLSLAAVRADDDDEFTKLTKTENLLLLVTAELRPR